MTVPNLVQERQLWAQGHRCVAGLDEAGRGARAGPVVAAAAILPSTASDLDQRLAGVRDSKLLTAARRDILFQIIQVEALAWGVGAVCSAEIDTIGIVPATRKAMALALQCLPSPADYLLVDHLSLPDVPLPQTSLPKGDARVLLLPQPRSSPRSAVTG